MARSDVDERIVRARGDHAADLDLRPRAGRARAGDQRARIGLKEKRASRPRRSARRARTTRDRGRHRPRRRALLPDGLARRLRWRGTGRPCCGVSAVLVEGVDGPVLVVRAPGQQLPALPRRVEVFDDARRGLGPLQGLAAGLAALQDRARRRLRLAPPTSPLLHPAVRPPRSRRALNRRARRRAPRSPAASAHPLAAALPHLRCRRAVARADRRATVCGPRSCSRPAGFGGCDAPQLLADPALRPPIRTRLGLNLNGPADYAAALARPAPQVTRSTASASCASAPRVAVAAGCAACRDTRRGGRWRPEWRSTEHVLAAVNGDQTARDRRAAAGGRATPSPSSRPPREADQCTTTRGHTDPPGGYFGRALVIDVDRRLRRRPLRSPPAVLRDFLGGAGLGTWLLRRLAPDRRRPARPRGPAGVRLLAAGRHPADDLGEVRRRRASPADRQALRCPGVVATSRSRASCTGVRRDRAIIGGLREPSRAARRRRRRARSRRPAGSGASRPREAEAAAARAARRGWQVAVDRPGRRAADPVRHLCHDGRHAGRGGLGAVLGSKRIKAVAVRPGTPVRRWPTRAGVLAAAPRPVGALVRPGDGEIPRAGDRSPTC